MSFTFFQSYSSENKTCNKIWLIFKGQTGLCFVLGLRISGLGGGIVKGCVGWHRHSLVLVVIFVYNYKNTTKKDVKP